MGLFEQEQTYAEFRISKQRKQERAGGEGQWDWSILILTPQTLVRAELRRAGP